jgi:hypothetical protein
MKYYACITVPCGVFVQLQVMLVISHVVWRSTDISMDLEIGKYVI